MRTMVSSSTLRRSIRVRRVLYAGVVIASISFVVRTGLAQAPPRGPDEPTDDLVARVHRAALTIDPHMDIRDDFNTQANGAGSETMGQLDLPKLERGGSWADSGAAFEQAVLAPFNLRPGDDARAKLDASAYEKYQQAYRDYGTSQTRTASLVDWIDTIDYAVRLIGIDHVGLSSDFNHGGGVIGYASVGDGLHVTRELLKRGYSEVDIDKLWGGNFLRVLKEVERVSSRLRSQR